MNVSSDVFVRVEGSVGRITLTRPQALNAINVAIVEAMLAALKAWEKDDTIALVLIDAEGEKAFSAGGDVAFIHDSARRGDIEGPNRFWRQEYRLNMLIARYPKPYVAIMDGIVMGGGVGISAHGSHRIVTDHSMTAMPECAIGLITDVGGTWLLARAPGHLGAYLGLSGARMTGADAIHAGFADIHVPRLRLGEIKAALVEAGTVAVLSDFATAPPPSQLAGHQERIDRIFSAETMDDILARLRDDGSDWAKKTATAIAKGSPLSSIMTLSAIRDARSLTIALRNEYRFVSRVLQHGDFLEGIRAMIIDKDRNPVWRYDDIASMPAELLSLMRSEADGGDPDFSR